MTSQKAEVIVGAGFDKADRDILKSGMKSSYTERFHTMTKLMKRSRMLTSAKIEHKPFIKK